MLNLKYRGTTYSYKSAQPIADAVPVTLSYRGVHYQPTNQPAPASAVLLKYRSTSYKLGQSGQPTEAIVPQTVSRRDKVAGIHQQSLLKNVQRRIEVAQKRGDDRLLALLLAEREQLAS
ncbi:DUF4278 domain-containing protein [Leptolyngbya ohadii]|uniref:DUF4278 domain-containing protein n=1 Tax=Leptolyngbya ohadii TaxID=1962290 RepID=UPI000B59EBDA|nr:DUF4278 domain-containing protein [Leptolyngbya ohadii]